MNGLRSLSFFPAVSAGVILVAASVFGQNSTGSDAAKTPAAVPTSPTIAFVGDRAITAAEVEGRAGARLFKARQEEYDAQIEAAREMAFDLLQDREAAKVGLTRDAFYRREVTDKVKDPTAEEVQQIFTTYRARLPKDDAAAKAEIIRVLRDRNTTQQVEAFKTRLLAGGALRVVIEPPRLEVPLDANDPVLGPATAAVTLVEFSDFQCPYCQRGQATVKQLHAEYGDRVRLAFKQLPLGMHPQARLAAEAALCAADQSKYWEAREWLFGHQGGVTSDSVKGWAKEAGLDETAFSKCLDSDAHAKDLQADMATADALATSSTPTFFVNGRLLQGALPVAQFREVIEDELSRAATKAPAAVKP